MLITPIKFLYSSNTTYTRNYCYYCIKDICCHCSFQNESERDTKRGVAADLQAEATSIAAGAKTEGAAVERNGAGAETGRAGTAGAPPGTTRSTGQWVEAADSL